MKDLGLPIELGSGVAAAQNYYRNTSMIDQKVAAE
jgi:alanine-glyoxylate transaminase/serine-glyoxylate transaminase/serine-pyruvate transaminase